MPLDLTTYAGQIALVVAVANLIGKKIPDSATGALGVIRNIAKFIGLTTENRTN
jgi:hypothetical protein